MSNIQSSHLKIKKTVPFYPDESQVIYVEGEYEFAINRFIQENFKEISKRFKEKGKTFVYVPESVKDLRKHQSYYNPGQEDTADITTAAISNTLFAHCTESIDIQAGLLNYEGTDDDCYVFNYFRFEDVEYNLWGQFSSYIESVNLYRNQFQNFDKTAAEQVSDYFLTSSELLADDNFNWEAKQLISDIRERIEQLKQKGINEMALKSLFPEKSEKLSRLVITNDYEIFLPDYNDLRITMYPLPKAVFLLFLNHPEGILFKHLPDYRAELVDIYKQISGRENIGDMEKSINDVVNPTLNSINEKCSRIREAFIRHFDESIALNYFITGERGAPKKISLNRRLVKYHSASLAGFQTA